MQDHEMLANRMENRTGCVYWCQKQKYIMQIRVKENKQKIFS